MPWSDSITGPARDIAASDDRRLRVAAGPGTGKTYALRHYVMRLLESGHDPRRVLVLTFTRTAARELRRELSAMAAPGSEKIWAGTLHAFCLRTLQSVGAFAAHDRTPRPLLAVTSHGMPGFEYAPLLADLDNATTFGNKRKRVQRIRDYEAAYARQQREEVFASLTEPDRLFEAQLVSWLRFHGAILIGELVPEALRFLVENPAAREHQAYDRIVVDEYQDLNKAEQTVIDILARSATLAIVGDADQSIYSFKYAHPEGIEDFLSRHQDTVDKSLVDCIRCGRSIVDVAVSLIKNNHLEESDYVALASLPANPIGEVHVVQWRDLAEEVAGVARFIEHLVASGRYGAKDILVLCPRRRIGYQIRNELRRLGVEAHSFFHEEALEDDHAQEAYALLKLLCDRNDRVALRFWLGFGSDDWRRNQYGKLREHCAASGDSPFEALEKMHEGTLSGTGYAQLRARFAILRQKLGELDSLSGRALLERIFPASAQWAEPLNEILHGTEIRDETTQDEILAALGEYISQPEIPSEPTFVRIMSLHASKGLTAKATIVATIVDSLIPNVDVTLPAAQQEAVVREQRRLFYVAATRSRELLVLSSPARISAPMAPQVGARVGSGGRTFPSRFLREIGPQHRAKLGSVWASSGYA